VRVDFREKRSPFFRSSEHGWTAIDFRARSAGGPRYFSRTRTVAVARDPPAVAVSVST
jgi:hypothetical protein